MIARMQAVSWPSNCCIFLLARLRMHPTIRAMAPLARRRMQGAVMPPPLKAHHFCTPSSGTSRAGSPSSASRRQQHSKSPSLQIISEHITARGRRRSSMRTRDGTSSGLRKAIAMPVRLLYPLCLFPLATDCFANRERQSCLSPSTPRLVSPTRSRPTTLSANIASRTW